MVGMPQNPYEAPKGKFSLRQLMQAVGCFAITSFAWSTAWRNYKDLQVGILAFVLLGFITLCTGLSLLLSPDRWESRP